MSVALDLKSVELEDFRLIARLHVTCESAGEGIDMVTSRVLQQEGEQHLAESSDFT